MLRWWINTSLEPADCAKSIGGNRLASLCEIVLADERWRGTTVDVSFTPCPDTPPASLRGSLAGYPVIAQHQRLDPRVAEALSAMSPKARDGMESQRHEWEQLLAPDAGEEIFDFAARIFPICRSITGDGVRRTLAEIRSHLALETREVPTGTQVFDWTIPREWNIRDAYIKNGAGEKIVDFMESNLHVMSYSIPVRKRVSLAELKKNVHTLPEQPDLIPYRTSYYADDWAFCMTHRQFETLADDAYDVVVDSSLESGSLTYGEYLHKGETDEEFLLSAHICHPSLANDNCSGIALLTHLAQRMAGLPTRYSYRFLFAPGTIGAIAWLAANEERAWRIKHGLVISMVGDGGGPTYKKSRRGNAAIDRAMAHVLHHSGLTPTIEDFSPYGYDERQYCSPGFDLPVGSFQRGKYGTIPQYHTSGDNLAFIKPEHLLEVLWSDRQDDRRDRT